MFFFNFKRFNVFIFRKRGREEEKERNINVWLPPVHPPLVTSHHSAIQACALTRNQTSDPLVCRLVLNPLSHTSQGKKKRRRKVLKIKNDLDGNCLRYH